MKELDYGKGYQYAHDEADAIADMSCLPPALEGRKYYEPKERGFEKEIKRRLDGWERDQEKPQRLARRERVVSCSIRRASGVDRSPPVRVPGSCSPLEPCRSRGA